MERRLFCPVCGREVCYLDEVFLREESGVAVGCSLCLRRQDADEWAKERREAQRDAWA